MIPILTRKEHPAQNPGDVFICYGLQWLIKQVVGAPQFYLIDKFNREDFSQALPVIFKRGKLLYAGTPQYNNYDDWCLWYDWDIYKEFLIPAKIKFTTFAGGAGYPDNSMNPSEFSSYCRSSEKTINILHARTSITECNTVRDEHSFQLLSDLKIKTELLPCTAFWASRWLGLSPKQSDIIGLVPADPHMIKPQLLGFTTLKEVASWQVMLFQRLQERLRELGYGSIIVCHSENEYQNFRFMYSTWYTNDPVTLLRVYEGLHGVISMRLHAAIPVAGMNKRALLLSIDTRANAASILGIPVMKPNEDIDLIISAYFSSSNNLTDKSILAEARYLELLGEVL